MAESVDENLVHRPEVKPVSRPAGSPAGNVAALVEQVRLRLVDFGNLLSREHGEDRRLEAAFETVCRSYGELLDAVRRG